MTMTANVLRNEDGSPTGHVEVKIVNGPTVVSHCETITHFGHFCGEGLEKIKEAEAQQDPD